MNAQDRLEFEKLRDILTDYTKLMGRLDERSINTYKLSEKMESHLEKSNGRLRKVENRFWYIMGALVVIGGGAGTALAQVF